MKGSAATAGQGTMLPRQALARPALRYHGGKFRLAPWILGHFPGHLCYVEPFAGGLSVLLQKGPARYEVANDLDEQVVNFFRVLREEPARFLTSIELTPYARREFEQAQEWADDPFERARRFYLRSWMAHGGPSTAWNSGLRVRRPDQANGSITQEWNNIEHLRAVVARLKNVQFECRDYGQLLRQFDHPATLFYCDPPYLPETRSSYRCGRYRCDMGFRDHIRLAVRLRRVTGMVALSGYASPLYTRLFEARGWRRSRIQAGTDGQRRAEESLWLNPALLCALDRTQPSLFGPEL